MLVGTRIDASNDRSFAVPSCFIQNTARSSVTASVASPRSPARRAAKPILSFRLGTRWFPHRLAFAPRVVARVPPRAARDARSTRTVFANRARSRSSRSRVRRRTASANPAPESTAAARIGRVANRARATRASPTRARRASLAPPQFAALKPHPTIVIVAIALDRAAPARSTRARVAIRIRHPSRTNPRSMRRDASAVDAESPSTRATPSSEEKRRASFVARRSGEARARVRSRAIPCARVCGAERPERPDVRRPGSAGFDGGRGKPFATGRDSSSTPPRAFRGRHARALITHT
jgi:hypothetical protein